MYALSTSTLHESISQDYIHIPLLNPFHDGASGFPHDDHFEAFSPFTTCLAGFLEVR